MANLKNISWRAKLFATTICAFVAILAAHIFLKHEPISQAEALKIAEAYLAAREVAHNPDQSKWETPKLVESRFQEFDHSWNFCFQSSKCYYCVGVEAHGESDVTGLRGC